MIRKTITMPEPMDSWVKAQVESGRYGNDSEYLRDLIRKDQERSQLQAMIDESQRAYDNGQITALTTREDVHGFIEGIWARAKNA
ncbi:type II toxin-antitoxin system ParD family antitoxin [Woodsholea maritima]|uniref:type II toxin-antitoxin system ParD family antitoxin n=1 Tax=Woodsholea maritima TaxID=240237 RepID=UPI000477C9A0|nr:type II toxin-antitoxin system ParD family antitoxin [Woodsholea maritima]